MNVYTEIIFITGCFRQHTQHHSVWGAVKAKEIEDGNKDEDTKYALQLLNSRNSTIKRLLSLICIYKIKSKIKYPVIISTYTITVFSTKMALKLLLIY